MNSKTEKKFQSKSRLTDSGMSYGIKENINYNVIHQI
jgi:hypothetical protein